MTRRDGILALLPGLLGSGIPAGARADTAVRYTMIDLSPVQYSMGGEIDWEATKKLDPNLGGNTVVTKPLPPPVPQGIEVRLGNRVVRFTAEEIMDALEGK